MKGKILIVRNFASPTLVSSYNVQEIGLGKVLVEKGYDCDIIFYHTKKSVEKQEIYKVGPLSLRILWMPAVKIFSNSIFRPVFKSDFLKKYDYIISTEYSQIMSYFLARKKENHTKLILYHGPYKDNNKLFIRKIYDYLFLKTIIDKTDYVFSKSVLAKDYLKNKGFSNPIVLGVGIDIENFLSEEVEEEYEEILNSMKGKRILLYIGRLEETKNIKFLFETFMTLRERDKDLYLLIIGTGKEKDMEEYFNYANELSIDHHIIHIPKISQKNLKFFYQQSEVFLLPSLYEIFGMVLLESLYFGTPVVTSRHGGSDLLLNQKNGVIVEEFDAEKWANAIESILADTDIKKELSINGEATIKKNFTWKAVTENLLSNIESEK